MLINCWFDANENGDRHHFKSSVRIDNAIEHIPDGLSYTNNEAEYNALLQLVLDLRTVVGALGFPWTITVVIHGDSQLVIRQMRGEYAVREERLKVLKALVDEHLSHIKALCANVQFKWIRREENNAALGLPNRKVKR